MRLTLRAFLLLTLFAGALASPLLASSYLVQWTFGDSSPVDMSLTTGFGPTAPDAATSNEVYGSVGTSSTGAKEGYAPVITTYNAGDYFQFSFSLSVSDPYVVNTVSFYARSFLDGATGWELKSSADGYSLVLGSGLTNQVSQQTVGSLGIAQSGNSTFTFRIFGTGGNADAFNGFVLDSVTVSGATSAVPEPSTYAAMFGLAALAVVGLRRRLRSV
jgi:hypothetical protein